jgi:hypothetical protein
MSGTCLEVVEQRMRESAGDIRLQPGMLTVCKKEIKVIVLTHVTVMNYCCADNVSEGRSADA